MNGLRATLKSSRRGLRALLDSLQADIICMQETKATSQLTHPDWPLLLLVNTGNFRWKQSVYVNVVASI